jgi:chromosome segregation ATPase
LSAGQNANECAGRIKLCDRVQERDGFKDQVGTLRDKVSALSRDLAENQDNSVSLGGQIECLKDDLEKAREDLATRKSKLAETEEKLQVSQKEAEKHQQRWKALENELQEACDTHARSAKSWLNEKQILTQVRSAHSFIHWVSILPTRYLLYI